jgi:hypothetical protein
MNVLPQQHNKHNNINSNTLFCTSVLAEGQKRKEMGEKRKGGERGTELDSFLALGARSLVVAVQARGGGGRSGAAAARPSLEEGLGRLGRELPFLLFHAHLALPELGRPGLESLHARGEVDHLRAHVVQPLVVGRGLAHLLEQTGRRAG